MSINARQLRELVIEPTLAAMSEATGREMGGDRVTTLLLMVAAHESRLGHYIKQVRGPALGIYQMEPATHDDHWQWMEARQRAMAEHIGRKPADAMMTDLVYATQMARAHFWRVPAPIPDTLEMMAAYAKRYYNTPLGKATPQDYLRDYERYV